MDVTTARSGSLDIDTRLSGTVNQLLDLFASTAPDELAVRFFESDASYEDVTAQQLRHRAWGIAELLRRHAPEGSRVLFLLPPGIDYIASFFGCLDAGMIAVPAYPLDAKNVRASLSRLSGMARDCEPAIALTATSDGVDTSNLPLAETGLADVCWIDVEHAIPTSTLTLEATQDPDRTALLQYTSGSTGNPRGVMVTHRNLLENLTAMYVAYGHNPGDALASWLPPYHDMGLIAGILLPIYGTATGYHMAPRTFVRNPELWLKSISDGAVTTTFAPNFAFDHIVSRVPRENLEGLDLSSWRRAINGAEPVRPDTLRRFAQHLEPTGFRPECMAPSYGLAESTLVATATPLGQEPLIASLDRDLLAMGEAVHADDDDPAAVRMVGCGVPLQKTEIRIVDPDTRRELPDGQVGEVWIGSPGVAEGYWGQRDESAEKFRAETVDGGSPSLRTGDLGFLFDGELFISGRRKDILIVDGRNVYPPDVEATLESEHPELRRGAGAVMPIEFGGNEHIVVCYEPAADDVAGLAELPARMRATLGSAFDVTPLVVAVVGRGSTPRTTSGKIQRAQYANLFGQLHLDVLAASYSPGAMAARPSSDEGRRVLDAIPADVTDETLLRDVGVTVADVILAAEGRSDVNVADVLTCPMVGMLGLERPAAGAATAATATESSAGREENPAAPVVAATVAGVLGVKEDTLRFDVPFRDLGVDSRSTTMICERLSEQWGTPIAPELIFDNPTITALAGALGAAPAEDKPSAADERVATSGARSEGSATATVAITGMACRLPGAADLDGYRQLLTADSPVITPSTDAEMQGRYAGWLDSPAVGDGKAFGISAVETAAMDPQQWLVLTACQHAIEDAGHRPEELAGREVGVFIGIGSSDHALQRVDGHAEPSIYEATGTSHALCANRVSYELDLRGPSVGIDTACSSSLVALHEAWRALRAGECEAALVAGVNLLAAPRQFEALEDGGVLATDGLARAFDDEAHGYVRGEGVGAVLLRTVEAAERDNDRIYAVLAGSAVGHSGRSNGITAPSSRAQEDVIRAALAEAQLDPRSVAFIESHGTGTQLGDPVELSALARVYGGADRAGAPCHVGTVKNTVGHLEAAAGIAGVLKAALALSTGRLPATLGITRPTSRFDWAASGLAPATAPVDLPPDGTVHAGVSSFGFGGANAHVVLSAAPEHRAGHRQRRNHAITLAGETAAELEREAGRLRAVAESTSDLRALVRAQDGDPAAPQRAVVVGADTGRMAEALTAVQDGAPHPAGIRWQAGDAQSREVVFVLPGQGSVGPGAVHDLFAESAPFARALEEKAARLGELGIPDALELLTDRAALPERLQRTDVQQPLLVALQLALASVLRRFGVDADSVVGHSVGELSAAALAGVLSEDDALELAVRRGEAMGRAPEGAMVACLGDPEPIRELVGRYPGWAVAAENGLRHLTVAGPRDHVEDLLRGLTEIGAVGRRLSVDHAFHTEAMASAAAAVDEWAAGLRTSPTSRRWISTLDAAPMTELRPGYWGEQMLAPVRFADALRSAAAAGPTAVIELGAVPSLVGRDRDLLPPEHCAVTATAKRDGAAAFLRSLAELAGSGVPVDFSAQEAFLTRQPLPLTDFDPQPESATTSRHAGRQPESAMATTSNGSMEASTVLEEIAAVSGFPVARIRQDDRLHSALGLDSLMLTALARKLGAAGGPDPDELAPRLVQDPAVSEVVALITGEEPTSPALPADPAPTGPARTDSSSVTGLPAAPKPAARDDGQPAAGGEPHEDPRDPSTWSEVRDAVGRFTNAIGGSDNPYARIHQGFNGARIDVQGQELVNFSAFDYLGLSHHPRVRRAAVDAVERFGTSAAATPLLYGETPVHKELEAAIADMLGTESAIVFSGGHATNVGVISALLGESDLIVHDEWSHDSSVRGALLSRATRRSFPHNDLASLDRILSGLRDSYRRSLVCVEGAYSQDGDLPDLPGLVEVARRTGSLLMVDEAHSIGVLGRTGRGIGEAQGVPAKDVDVWMGTLSKALASLGGYIAGSKGLIEFLRYAAPLYLFSTGPSPANAAAALEAIRVIRDEPDRVRALHERADHFRQRARAAGLDIGVSRDSAVVPVITGDWSRTIEMSNMLLESGFNAMPIGYPAVPADACRIRFFINAEHDVADLDAAVDRLATILGKDPLPPHSAGATVRTHAPRTPDAVVTPPVNGSPVAGGVAGGTFAGGTAPAERVAQGPRAIVQGAASGVGRALVERLSAEGTPVVPDGDEVAPRPGDIVFECRVAGDGDAVRERILTAAPGTRVVLVTYSDRLPDDILPAGVPSADPGDDEALLALAQGARVSLTILHAPAVFGPHCHGTVAAAAAGLRSGLITANPAWGRDAELVGTANLAAAAIQAARSELTSGRRFTVADPRPVTWGQYLTSLGAATGTAANGLPTLYSVVGTDDVAASPAAGQRAGSEALAVFWRDQPHSFPRSLVDAASWWWTS